MEVRSLYERGDMSKTKNFFFCSGLLICGLLMGSGATQGQEDRLGHSIGKVSTEGDLIVMELDEGVLGKSNLFDLAGRTLRFNSESSRYRVENTVLQWDPEFGPELQTAEAMLHNFTFPFSGKNWNSFSVLALSAESRSVDSTSWQMPRVP